MGKQDDVEDAAFDLCKKGGDAITIHTIARKARCTRKTVVKYLDANPHFHRERMTVYNEDNLFHWLSCLGYYHR